VPLGLTTRCNMNHVPLASIKRLYSVPRCCVLLEDMISGLAMQGIPVVLSRGTTVFNRTTMVLFLCRNKSSQNGTKLCEDFLYNKRKILEPRTTGGGTWVGTTHQGASPFLARPSRLSPPGGLADANPDTISSHLSRKNQREKIS